MNKQPIRSLAREFRIPRELLLECAARGHALLEAGCFDDAIEMARGLVAADEENSYSRRLLATALFRRGDVDDALGILESGLRDPDVEALRTHILNARKNGLAPIRTQPVKTATTNQLSETSESDFISSAALFRSLRC